MIQGGNTDRPGATDDWTLRGKHNSQLDTRFAPHSGATPRSYPFAQGSSEKAFSYTTLVTELVIFIFIQCEA